LKKLSKEASKLKKSLAREYDISDQAGALLLQTAFEAYDEFQAAKGVVDIEGLTVRGDRGGIKSHPLLAVIRDARSQFLMSLKMLNLDLEPLRDARGRPPGR
jgi:phage terminase small subunit